MLIALVVVLGIEFAIRCVFQWAIGQLFPGKENADLRKGPSLGVDLVFLGIMIVSGLMVLVGKWVFVVVILGTVIALFVVLGFIARARGAHS